MQTASVRNPVLVFFNQIQEILIITLSPSLCIMDYLNVNESICMEGSSVPGGGGILSFFIHM